MRSFIRHPADIPIEVRLDRSDECAPESLNNISLGGLSFTSQSPFIPGALVSFSVSVAHGCVESRGRVTWCRERMDGYEVGIEFLDADDYYTVRMVEQVCHIEHYKQEMLRQHGRELSGEEAAEEWIEKYAANFPSEAKPRQVS